MARLKGSKDTKKRAAKKTAYETYSYWYDRYTKDPDKAKFFSFKYNEQEFASEYNLTKLARLDNPARRVAQSQLVIDLNKSNLKRSDLKGFAKKYEALFNEELPDLKDAKVREQIFIDFKDILGLSWSDADEHFQKYFY